MDEQTEELDFDQTDFEFATGQRRFKRQTEEERIYGIWALDDDENESSSFNANKKRAKDNGPVKFVSGGVKIGSKTQTQLPDGTIEEGAEEDEIIIEARPEKRARTTTGFGGTKMEAGSQVFAGMRTANFQNVPPPSADSAWMKSGKSNVIMQMMQKMGYEQGKGLGKSKQGIVEPIQAMQRPGRGAVGAYGSEAKGPKFGESAAEAQARISSSTVDPFGTVEPTPVAGRWRKGNANRVKVQYKTLDDVISEGAHQQFGASTASYGKIIDMTGPEQKVYDDFSSFSRRARRPVGAGTERKNFDIPELTHNLDTLLDVTEEEICKTDKQIRHLKDQNQVLIVEQERIETELVDSQNEIDRLESVQHLIKRFYQSHQGDETSLDECKQLFQTLSDEYSVEYTLYGLDAIAIPILLPKIKAYFSNWDPLDPEQDSYGLTMMTEWKEILGNAKGGSLFKHFEREKGSSISAYDHCVWSGWMPTLRRAVLSWDPRNNCPVMVSVVQLWMPILPPWVLENFLEQVLLPKIKEQVDSWDPVTDTVPIETWLRPWHSVMGDRLMLIYATLRQKLAKGLKNWFPGDRSAIESIRPWKGVFSSSTMHTFVGMNIVPKLEQALQTIDITNTEQFEYMEIFDWLELISVDVISQVLIKHFFPRYYQQTCYQLSSSQLSMAEFENIKKAYMEWKNLMPIEVQKYELVMAELKRILVALSQAQLRLTGNVNLPPHSSAQPTYNQPMAPGPFGLPPPPAQFTAQLPPASFKQLVESSAVYNGIQFFPQRSKLHQGKQVYMFGDYSVYIDGTMLFYYNPTKRDWLPASLNHMLEMVRSR